ncbi:MAG: NADH:ubiquinone oxidoreductase [Candidatus Woesearchaeota archaeon]|jgi:sulfhydrogenase subunit delta
MTNNNETKKDVAEEKSNGKPNVGFYALTGCQGCLLSIIFNEDDILDIVNAINIKSFPFISELKVEPESFDVIFMEGLVADNHDVETLKRLREKTKILIGIGACACTGGVGFYRNYIPRANYEYLTYNKEELIKDRQPMPLDSFVKVDLFIPGCPPEKEDVKRFIKNLLLDKRPVDNNKPVCYECKLNKNKCLLLDGKPCLGTFTAGGCNSVCVNGGMECWGCRGPTTNIELDINDPEMFNIWKCDKELVKDRLKTFAGLKFKTVSGEIKNDSNY